MKCEKCGNEYSSQYYFTTPTICNECFKKINPEEQQAILKSTQTLLQMDEMAYRVGFGKRLGAALLDSAILVTIILIVFYFSGFFKSYLDMVKNMQSIMGNQEEMAMIQKQFMNDFIFNFYFLYLLTLVYYSLEILVGASIGKMILGIQIGRADRRTADSMPLILRYLIKNLASFISIIFLATQIQALNTVSVLFSVAVLVGFFFVLGRKRQAFHDMFAKTAIFYKKDIIQEEILI